jgi:hypothetical protein
MEWNVGLVQDGVKPMLGVQCVQGECFISAKIQGTLGIFLISLNLNVGGYQCSLAPSFQDSFSGMECPRLDT